MQKPMATRMENGSWYVDGFDNNWMTHKQFSKARNMGLITPELFDISDEPYRTYQLYVKWRQDMEFAKKNMHIVKKDLGLTEGEMEASRDKVKREL